MDKVRIEVEDAVRNVILNRPAKRNALDSEMLSALNDAFTGKPDPAERVVALKAEGPAFCAGLDMRERRKKWDEPSGIEEVLHAIETYPLPVVAVVHGDAIAGGNDLVLHCDLVVASTNAAFGMSLAQIGLAPSWSLAKKLLEVAGPVAAREILLLGDPLPAKRMYELGIISRVVPRHQLDSAARAVLGRLASNAPLALRTTKKLLVRQMVFRDGINHDDVDALITEVVQSQDVQEGMSAVLEHRPARFTGE